MATNFEPRSKDLEKMELDKLRSVFPECFVEDKLNIDKLLTIVGEHCLDDYEKYEFRWKGKSESLLVAQQRSMATLRPCVEESVDWDNTQNLYIEGDNLEVLRLLQRSYHRKVKMIYIDPPYNTGHDFVYKDDYTDSIGNYKRITEQDLRSNAETSGRYHTEWLNMMYPRLRQAKYMLRDDGVIFISIDDNEVHNLRKLCDEVFGEDNFIAQLAVQLNPRGRHLDRFVAKTHEYVVVYCRTYDNAGSMKGIPKEGKMIEEYNNEDERGKHRLLGLRNRNQAFNPTTRPNLYYPLYVNPDTRRISLIQGDTYTDEVWPDTPDGTKTCWTWSAKKVEEENDLLTAEKTGNEWRIYRKDYLMGESGESATTLIKSLWAENELNNDYGRKAVKDLFGSSVMDFPKPIELIKRAIAAGTDKDSIVLDFFSGSATTAHAVMQLNVEDGGNRRFIMVQLPEKCAEDSEAYKAGYNNICEIGKERIRRAGAKIIAEQAEKHKQIELGEQGEVTPLDIGFRVFKLDTSNIKKWDSNPINRPTAEQTSLFMQRLNDMIDSVKPDRTNLDLAFEVLLKLGNDLCEPVMSIEFDNVTAYAIGAECRFMVCLDEGITVEHAEQMAEYAPGIIVFGDKCFEDTTALANVDLALKDMGIDIQII